MDHSRKKNRVFAHIIDIPNEKVPFLELERAHAALISIKWLPDVWAMGFFMPNVPFGSCMRRVCGADVTLSQVTRCVGGFSELRIFRCDACGHVADKQLEGD